MSLVSPGVPLVLVALALVAVAAVAARIAVLGVETQVVVAAIRAAVQLSVVALIITGVLHHKALSFLFVVGMLVAAAFTGAGRIADRRAAAWTGLAIAAGAA